MNVIELERLIFDNEAALENINLNKVEFEKYDMVKSYLEHIEKLEELKKYKLFLSKLEIGEDGTIFSERKYFIDKSISNTHFGLSKTLMFAIGFIQRFNYEDYYNSSCYFRLSYDKFQKYLDNAISILNDMRYYDGDRIVENDYNLDVYENPKNYSIVDFKSLGPFNYKGFKDSYNLDNVLPGGNGFVSLSNIPLLASEIDKLNKREYEAFFGERAQQILGYSKIRSLGKNK